MTTTTQSFSWRFGGWLSEASPAAAWTILGLAAIGGVAFTVWSYRHALAQLEPARRYTLSALRLALILVLLVILAAPTRVERTFEGNGAERPLAILVDRSGSMITPDNRQRRRLDNALLRWREMEPSARVAFRSMKSFAFAESLKPVASPETSIEIPSAQTNLFSSLQSLLAQAPPGGWGGIVTLTDGLDTSSAAASEGLELTARNALAANTPLYFLPGRNRYAGGVFLTLRELNVPTTVAPNSKFRVEATFDSYQASAHPLNVGLKVNGILRPLTPVRVEAGRHLVTWSGEVESQGAGLLDLELRAGDEVGRTTVHVEAPPTNKILYFQGALDWGYRFFSDILKRDAAFSLTPVFNFPNPKALLPPGALAKMPATSAELAGFDIIVLANAAAEQFSEEQQAVLSKWVRDGGILLFLTPDDDSTQGFAGSELEKMLPVVFMPPQPADNHSANIRAILSLRVRTRLSDESAEVPPLTSFVWEDSPHVREIFAEAAKQGGTPGTPVFSAFAHVARAKPGAEVLARHPQETLPGSTERAILLAIQRYGQGRSAVLTTDALWRWKLNQASTGRGVELFWQNLFAWLTRDKQRGLHFDHPPLHAEKGREVVFRIQDSGTDELQVKAVNRMHETALNEGPSVDNKRTFSWTPTEEGLCHIVARGAGGREFDHWVTVDKQALTGEFSGMAPNEDIMQALAVRTGGGVLEREAPASWLDKPAATELLTERRQPLWDREWIFGILVGLYGVELLLRRRWHLL